MARIALLLVIVAVVGACTDAPSPQPGWQVTLMSPSAGPSLTGTATPAPVRGAQGHPLSLPRVGTLTVGSAGVWHPSDFKAAAGNRFVAVSVSLSAKTKVALDRASFALVDETLSGVSAVRQGHGPGVRPTADRCSGEDRQRQVDVRGPLRRQLHLALHATRTAADSPVLPTGLSAGQS